MSSEQMQVAAEAIAALRAGVRGRVVDASAAEYDDVRQVFYSAYNRRPLAIVQVADAADVSRVLAVAQDAKLPIAVRNGGHSPAGHSTVEGGIVIDVSRMKALDVDVSRRTAWADAGMTAGEYTDAVGEHGLATGFGDAGSVGISGITLGGGVGFLHRRFGLTADNVLAADIVTANGEQLRVNAESHPDLFWAIRGGGGNFGVVTRWQYRLHEVGNVHAGFMVFPASPDAIPALLNAAAEASDALAGVIAIMPAPPMPVFPAEIHGQMVIMANLVHSGSEAEAERELSRLRSIATPILDMIRPAAYPAVYHHGEPPRPPILALRPTFVDHVDRSHGDVIIDSIQQSRAPMRLVQFRILGGAVARVARDATAFAHRDRGMMAMTAAGLMNVSEIGEHQAWADAFGARLQQGEPGAYIGFMSDTDASRIHEAYPDDTRTRLAGIKARYDPANLFRLNQNIHPFRAEVAEKSR